jgi:acyl dehydratase
MSEASEKAFALFTAAIGETEGTGEWFDVTQEDINTFADVTRDHQFIHVDPDACATMSPWGVPIAHGFLTLSMLTHLSASIPMDPSRLEGIVMGVNYGFDKVRFVNPVKVGSRIRATSVIGAAELKGDQVQVTRNMTVEIEGQEKPALVADWLTRLVYG